MNDNNSDQGNRTNKRLAIAVVAGLAVIILAMIFIGRIYRDQLPTPPVVQIPSDQEAVEVVEEEPVLDFDRMRHDETFAKEMQDRKDKYQIDDGVDMIVREDESVKVGDSTVSMEEIKEKSDLGKGRVVEKDLQKTTAIHKQDAREYGIHVVRPGENIWDIHFALLREYFQNRDITLAVTADEPYQNGTSSGVGRILKFSENMVIIYNVKKDRIELDLDMIHPLEKIVVYQMDEVFDLLSQIDYQDISDLKFDGTTLWIPAEE